MMNIYSLVGGDTSRSYMQGMRCTGCKSNKRVEKTSVQGISRKGHQGHDNYIKPQLTEPEPCTLQHG